MWSLAMSKRTMQRQPLRSTSRLTNEQLSDNRCDQSCDLQTNNIQRLKSLTLVADASDLETTSKRTGPKTHRLINVLFLLQLPYFHIWASKYGCINGLPIYYWNPPLLSPSSTLSLWSSAYCCRKSWETISPQSLNLRLVYLIDYLQTTSG